MDIHSINRHITGSKKDASKKFEEDVLNGLLSSPKKLYPKYFYDEEGTALFRKIMDTPEYYLTGCELDIFKNKTAELAKCITPDVAPFDLIELGAGDGFKSKHLLHYLSRANAEFTYMPIDISNSILGFLRNSLQTELPRLQVQGFEGEYMEMLTEACASSNRRKVILFLGANIGNMEVDESINFCRQLRTLLSPGDLVLIGFDLKKNPKTVLSAYNDKSGVTSMFNLNLLKRINRELLANFVLDQYEHYPMYDPVSGSCRSFLVSLRSQHVNIGKQTIQFEKDEVIAMEISQKYNLNEIRSLAKNTGFETVGMVMDSQEWFVDAIWKIK
ncbi:L-histidine N(alpha)-methyltransferase [Parapedobacter deserti]|uniref:L-histidine N(Alpha)-methyltransferase n=1 Tax=Parapedobacter deserti TaxID=1912957 RepID=A0ABV7JQK3_9SPHI